MVLTVLSELEARTKDGLAGQGDLSANSINVLPCPSILMTCHAGSQVQYPVLLSTLRVLSVTTKKIAPIHHAMSICNS